MPCSWLEPAVNLDWLQFRLPAASQAKQPFSRKRLQCCCGYTCSAAPIYGLCFREACKVARNLQAQAWKQLLPQLAGVAAGALRSFMAAAITFTAALKQELDASWMDLVDSPIALRRGRATRSDVCDTGDPRPLLFVKCLCTYVHAHAHFALLL